MGELLVAAFEVIAVFRLNGVLDGARDRVVNTQDRSLNELDLPGGIATEITTGRGLSLPPGLGGRGITPGVGRRHTARDAKSGRRVILSASGVGRTGAVGVVVGGSGLDVARVSFIQAVAGSRASHGRRASVRFVKGAGERAGVVLIQQRSGRIVVWLSCEVVLLQAKFQLDTEPPVYIERKGTHASGREILKTMAAITVAGWRSRALVGHGTDLRG